MVMLQLLQAGQTLAETEYWTNSSDRYYHMNSECNRPADKTDCYERRAYTMVPVSEDAALEFGKKPCPICVKRLKPTYIGEAKLDWKFDAEPWSMNTVEDYGERRKAASKAFLKENEHTHEKFEAYYREIYDKKTGTYSRKHDYPDCFAGLYLNAALGYSYMIADPTAEIAKSFKRMFGGGAWLVPAKYGQKEILAEGQKIWEALIAWCGAHPEIDASPAAFGQDTVNNAAEIGICGTQWRTAAEAMEADAPVYIYFEFAETPDSTF